MIELGAIRKVLEVFGSKGIVCGLVVSDKLVMIRDEIGEVIILKRVFDRVGDVELLLGLSCVARSLGSNERGLTG